MASQNSSDRIPPWHAILNPIVLIAMGILVGTFFLFLAAIIGFDSGVLQSMSEPRFARGVITYLFAVITIGTAVVLVVYSLTSPEGGDDARFNRAKDVLGLLLGVFGTIVGFYFGQEVGERAGETKTLQEIVAKDKQPGQGGEVSKKSSGEVDKEPSKEAVKEPSEETKPTGGENSSDLNPE